jgi:PhnB protein
MSGVKPIPEGYEGVTPYLCVRDAARAIDFYKLALGAVEVVRLAGPSGKVGHAELRIGRAPLMLSDEFPETGVRSPQTLGGAPVSLQLYTEDADALFARAVAAGAKVLRPVADQFYGDRGGKLEDPFGHVWWIATRKTDVSPEEMQRRAAALFGGA